MKVRSVQRVIDSLEAQIKEQQLLISSNQDEAAQYQSTATQMRYSLTPYFVLIDFKFKCEDPVTL